MIKIGSAGFNVDIAHFLKENRMKCAEIEFVRQIYLKKEEKIAEIKQAALSNRIQLSVHAPYYINLNSAEKEKVEKSKQRILECLKIGTWLMAYRVVFHPGYYSNFEKLETFEKIKAEILDIMKTAKEKNYTPKLAPETTGKINVFGSIEEISSLVENTGCEFCIDFAHILAREKDYNFKKIKEKFGKSKKWHVHFSGIEFGEKGEKRHKPTEKRELKKLLENLPDKNEIVVINESPQAVEDSVLGLNICHRQNAKN